MTCAISDGCFNDKSKMIDHENAMIDGLKSTNFGKPIIYYEGNPLMMKVGDYVPPVQDELDSQALVINTWIRGTSLPNFFWTFFRDTFLIAAYTCD